MNHTLNFMDLNVSGLIGYNEASAIEVLDYVTNNSILFVIFIFSRNV